LRTLFYTTFYPQLFSEQAEARRTQNKEMRKRREERLVIKRKELFRKISESEKDAKDTTK
jgi:hypothetical protein